MAIIDNKNLLNRYTSNTGICDIFSANISEYINLHYFDKGEYLIRESECSDTLYFLASGRVKVFSHSSCGKVLSLSHFNSFEIIGEASSLWEELPAASVKATTKVYCLGISMKYKDIVLNDVKFLRFMCENLGKRLRSTSNNSCINLFDSLDSRLASFILSHERNGTFHYNLSECAELLNTSYRHLLRVLSSFCNEGVLSKSGRSYNVINESYLIQISSNLSEFNS